MTKPNVICITPIKNEQWILDNFIQCTSLWADYIIIADQNSTDKSKEIAQKYPKVILVDNPSSEYNESSRSKILIEAARHIPEPRLIIALDADEMFTANFMCSPEWGKVLQVPPGTMIKFNWANVAPDFQYYWNTPMEFHWGLMDDGTEHIGSKIHSNRIPISSSGITPILLKEIRVLHYQYTHTERVKSKQRWYQCWERLNDPTQSSLQLYRRHHHMDAISKNDMYPLPKEWLSGYEEKGIDMTTINRESIFWWDREIVDWIAKYGAETFRKQAIWHINWADIANQINAKYPVEKFSDPRNPFDKFVHNWLKSTQGVSPYRLDVRIMTKILNLVGW